MMPILEKNDVLSMMTSLRREKINTWFDLGLFIDRMKENKPVPTFEFGGTFSEFKTHIREGGVAFITFYFSIDGVSIEVEKYAKTIRFNLGEDVPIHYIAGKFYPESYKIIDPETKTFSIDAMQSFDDWNLYKDFFFTKLERGSKEYNALIIKFWEQVLELCEQLGNYIQDNDIRLLYLINVCSNPGNVALSLACVLVSELMGIPVINNNHDFFWEGGNRKVDIETKKLKPGPRDFFFTNSDVGEFFSQLEVLFPWESRSWINVNINQKQSDHLIHYKGHNPANVMEIGTAVDLDEYSSINKRQRINALYQVEKMLSRYNEEALVSYSVKDVLEYNLVDQNNPEPIYIGYKTRAMHKFLSENIIFLQPTRVISRKRIEIDFKLIGKVFDDERLKSKLRESDDLKITILITGPIPMGQYKYFLKLLHKFEELLETIDSEFQKRIYLGFLFSEMDKERFKTHFKQPIGIPEIYSISSLVLLPSKTEGRGLPILEAAAAGVPIFCSRYEPENVYAEVIGEHLPEKDRLKVIELEGTTITEKHVEEVIGKVFFPHKYHRDITHNTKVLQRRYSIEALNQNLEEIGKSLYLQVNPNEEKLDFVGRVVDEYLERIQFRNKDVDLLLDTENRQYLPGYGKLAFMLNLKSLIDPSAFRVEEQEIRGTTFYYAKKQVEDNPEKENLSKEQIHAFYNSVDNIFHYRKGEVGIRHDHSFAYRHRNKNYYPFHDLTHQELSGLVNLFKAEWIKPIASKEVKGSEHFFTDKNLALSQLTSCSVISIDDRQFLFQKMASNFPMAYFPGKHVKYELEYFVLNSIRSRLGMKMHENITKEVIKSHRLAPIFVFAPKISFTNRSSAKEIEDFITTGFDPELQLLYQQKVLQVIETELLTLGIHIPLLGEEALKKLRWIMEEGGYLITNRRNAPFMTDVLNMDRFHIGMVTTEVAANIMGIPLGTGYIQFVPAGVRTTLAYPTPIQTGKDFSELLKSEQFQELCRDLGEEEVFQEIRKDARMQGSPLKEVLKGLKKKTQKQDLVDYNFVTGVYKDGLPWNGVIAQAKISERREAWEFAAVSSINSTKKVTAFASEFEKKRGKSARIAWNGGYILNPELVGKLGLPESYIGSPLGLLISEGKVISTPLFNKPALLIYPDGRIDIQRVKVADGIRIRAGNKMIEFSPENYNQCSKGGACYYDLMYEGDFIPAFGHVIVRLAGNTIKEVIRSQKSIQQIPVGLTLCIPESDFPEEWNEVGRELEIEIVGLDGIRHAIEAGPLLLDNGEPGLNMEIEGWKTQNSIRTQAARLDYTDMRGPKIAVGIDGKGDLFVLTINGRIRESVGATHVDMANIMQQFGMKKAMGFDPGGSSTLVVEGKTLNISPYNSEYEKNIYALPPEPRAVANAVIGYLK
ncbi:MAG: phosphodiester glycosidase family protein [Marinifilaceae bacterium]